MSTTLKMDFDFKPKIKEFLERHSIAFFLLELTPVNCMIFETAHGYHVYIVVAEDLDNWSIVAIQAILGSDFKRECFNFKRIQREPYSKDGKKWNLLFRKKWDNEHNLISEEKYDEDLTRWFNGVLSNIYNTS